MLVGKSDSTPLRKWARVLRDDAHLDPQAVLEALGIAA
jgi:hypothetical protein